MRIMIAHAISWCLRVWFTAHMFWFACVPMRACATTHCSSPRLSLELLRIHKKEKGWQREELHEGKLQGQFVEKTRNMAHKFSGKWKRNGFLKKNTECMLFAAQEQALSTNANKANIDKQPVSPKCSCVGQKKRLLCIYLVVAQAAAETVQKKTWQCHQKSIHWKLCKKHGLKSSHRRYECTPAEVMENDEGHILS